MKQLSAKLKSRGATVVVLTLALGAAVYLNWSFSREAPPSLVVSDTAGEAVETSAQAAEPITDPLVLETAAGADTQMMSADETANKNYGEAQLVSVNKDSGTEFFESARLTRSKARDEALDTLDYSDYSRELALAASVDAVREVLRNAGINAAVSWQNGVCVITPVDPRDKPAIEALLAVNAGELPWRFAEAAP
ncbi:SpoIIIAH-like family protein [Gemmiger formicilis]|uniref:SpoIIIAH-like family protein n=1 Tax=Gemmiger formicilis TaxID=745368 RepID=UPI00241EE220|nr:SpoIIIAH-like family protein [Gemmiger formicilis]